MDPFGAYKALQRQVWPNFAPLEGLTIPAAAQLVLHARIQPGQRVVDLACGTGVVAVTAARLGAKVTALDLTPELLVRARENAAIANVDVDFHEGDVEKLPFADAAFDVVLSQFGHMFAPRPAVAIGEMLRVLKPGGTIAFSTWPPEHAMGRVFRLISGYMPPPPVPVAPPPQWGDEKIVRERLGDAVSDIKFQRESMNVAALSLHHYREMFERTAGPMIQLVQTLSASDEPYRSVLPGTSRSATCPAIGRRLKPRSKPPRSDEFAVNLGR